MITSTMSEVDIFLDVNIESLQDILNQIDNTHENLFDAMQWGFAFCRIDFSSVENLKKNHPNWVKCIDIDLVLFSKIMLLASFENNSRRSRYVKSRFNSILKTLFYLAERDQKQINKTDLGDYFSYFLMNSLHENIPTKRLTPLSYKSHSFSTEISDWFQTIKKYQLPLIGFISAFSDGFILKNLKNSIEILSGGDLTYHDWKQGGSFNHLTLNYGCFYIEHCTMFFENHINLAIAIRQTLKQCAFIVKEAGLSVSEDRIEAYFRPCISHFMAGKNISNLKPNFLKTLQEKWWLAIQKVTLRIFESNLRPYCVLEQLLSKSEINNIAKQAGINSLNKINIESLKFLIQCKWSQLNPEHGTFINDLFSLEFQSFKTVVSDDLDITNIHEKIENNYFRLFKEIIVNLPSPEFFDAIGISDGVTKNTHINNFLRFVEHAGIINFVAVTGWRESEFGFGLEDIKVQPNLDLLDQYTCPVRYEINWIVPKTNARTKVSREITHSAFRCAIKLAQVKDVKPDEPCLYSYNSNARNIKVSGAFIANAIPSLWNHFVWNYKQFKQLDILNELKTLKNKDYLSDSESRQLLKMNQQNHEENWEEIESNILLTDAYKRSRLEFDRVKFLLDGKRRGFVWAYHKKILRQEYSDLLDNHLSQETKEAIRTLKSKNDATPSFASQVTNELLENCLYPTPHAIRHMWAEAVYRRFDGDVGWMIRSNFKHINQSMWLAYIQNKDNLKQHNRVKRNVVSSLLANYVRKKGVGYTGAIDKLFRRLFLNTRTTSIEQLNYAIEAYSMIEIEDIKTNPWGFCILRKRVQANAKCAELGVPQRHNASPALCLGCTNNLSQNGNVEGILLGVGNDINVVANSKVPSSFRRASFQTVKIAYKQLKKLNIDPLYLIELEDTLKIGKECGFS